MTDVATASKTERSVKALETTREVYGITKKYYADATQAKKEKTKPIVWTVGLGPFELLFAMDCIPMMPENFSAMSAAKQVSRQGCEAAEAKGFNRETCAYFRNHYGFCTDAGNLPPAPAGGLPLPDLLIASRNTCNAHAQWWRLLEEYYKVPTFILDMPVCSSRYLQYDPGEYYTDYIVSQYKKLIKFLEEQTGKKFDIDKLRERVKVSDDMAKYWEECQIYRKASPCPAGAEDMCSNVAFIITMAGNPMAVDFYKKLAAEMKEKVEKGEGVLQNEKHRLIIDNIPPWYSLGLFNYFYKYDSIAVMEMYTAGFHHRVDPRKPFESLARKHLGWWCQLPFDKRDKDLLKRVRDWKVDAALFLANRSCKTFTLSQWHHKDLLWNELRIPSLIVEIDQCDPRDYSEGQTKTRIDAFMEMLG